MTRKREPEMVEICKDFFVPKKELLAHENKMAAGIEASKKADTMSPEEEEEWEIAKHFRNAAATTLRK